MGLRAGQAVWVRDQPLGKWRAAIVSHIYPSGCAMIVTADGVSFYPYQHESDLYKSVTSWERWLHDYERDCWIWWVRQNLDKVASRSVAEELWQIIDHNSRPHSSV